MPDDTSAPAVTDEGSDLDEDFFRQVFEHSPDPMGVTRYSDGRVLAVNRAWEEAFGIARAEAVGRTAAELGLSTSRERLSGLIATLDEQGRADRTDLVIEHTDGRVMDGACSVRRFGDVCHLFQFHDLTAERRVAAQLRESEARFQQLARSIHDVVLLHDVATDRGLYVSPAWETLTGHPAALALGPSRARFAVVADEDRERVTRTFEAHGTAGPLRQEYRLLSAGGAIRVVEERTFPIPGTDGRPWRVAGVLTDLTERRRLEEGAQRAQRLNALGQLTRGVAHEFNNMIGSIMFAIDELATLCRGDPERAELCDLILNSARRSRDLTRQMLSFSRQGSTTIASIDLNQLVWDTIAVLRKAVDRRVMILGDLRASPSVVLGDRAQLHAALLALGVRAKDAMTEGGELTFETEQLHLDELACSTLPFQLAPGAFVRVTVTDTGDGLSTAAAERLFEPFTADPGAGDGLGLAVVYGTAVAHGGAVTVHSDLSSGTRCCLYLPVAPDAAPAPPPPTIAAAGSGLVLVIDDEPLLRYAVARVLTGLGYTVEAAEDGADALARFRVRHAQVVAVLCDINMPRSSGPEVVRELRRIDPGVPVIMASGFARDQTIARLGDLAIDGYLAKPVERVELAAVLAAVARKV